MGFEEPDDEQWFAMLRRVQQADREHQKREAELEAMARLQKRARMEEDAAGANGLQSTPGMLQLKESEAFGKVRDLHAYIDEEHPELASRPCEGPAPALPP